ncbi:MAG: dodecin domain-containing protein [Flavobacteriales bacterium]|nr:dodecin domain-containing protein [Flavobacteriales bacterium]
MSVLKVVEILANSNKGWEDAAQKAVTHAAQTIKNIKSVYINEQSAVVKDNKITEYRVNAKITFEVN